MRVLKAVQLSQGLSRLCTGAAKKSALRQKSGTSPARKPYKCGDGSSPPRTRPLMSATCTRRKNGTLAKKIAAARRLTSHNTLPDHDVLLRARLA